ncbi:MAG: metal-dependent transcriptional regulator [Oscillospiraceae bacterium]
MAIHESSENYLETILILKKTIGAVRSIDIANELSFSKPSVSVAMKNLRNENLIIVDEKGMINLTDKGNEIASKIYERHVIISNFLIDLGVDEETAHEDACKIEHIISEVSFQKMKEKYLIENQK